MDHSRARTYASRHFLTISTFVMPNIPKSTTDVFLKASKKILKNIKF